MSYQVTFYLPYPAHVITRHTYHNLSLARARSLAVQQRRRYTEYGPVMILDDLGGVVANDQAVKLLMKEHTSCG